MKPRCALCAKPLKPSTWAVVVPVGMRWWEWGEVVCADAVACARRQTKAWHKAKHHVLTSLGLMDVSQ